MEALTSIHSNPKKIDQSNPTKTKQAHSFLYIYIDMFLGTLPSFTTYVDVNSRGFLGFHPS